MTYAMPNTMVGFDTILGGTGAQHGRAVAFDTMSHVLAGSDFAGAVQVLDPTGDAGGRTPGVARACSSPGTISRAGPPARSRSAPARRATTRPSGASLLTRPAPPSHSAAASPAPPSSPDGTSVTTSQTTSAVYVARVDGAVGNVLWLKQFGNGVFTQSADALAVDPSDGSILVAGHFQGTLDFGGTATPPLVNMTAATSSSSPGSRPDRSITNLRLTVIEPALTNLDTAMRFTSQASRTSTPASRSSSRVDSYFFLALSCADRPSAMIRSSTRFTSSGIGASSRGSTSSMEWSPGGSAERAPP